MEGALLAFIIAAPVSCCIGLYKCFNYGTMPCIDTSAVDNHNKTVPTIAE